MHRRLVLVALLLALVAPWAWGSSAIPVDDTVGGVPIAAATSFARYALISCETATIRFEYDGTAPTATTGHVLVPGQYFVLEGYQRIRQFRAIRTTSTSATCTVSFEE